MQNSQAEHGNAVAAQRYQPEIDGIRAIAVLSVVLFHLEFKWISGGFVGVDVFFVISGFLITRLIVKDVRAGQFSFGQFYLRRLRRLGPALISVLAATFATAVFFLPPEYFQRFSGALMASMFSLSNFFFWAESGYFDATAELKPLLHTWSLSVEEQFYLIWPALIVLCTVQRRWMLPLVVFLLSLVSLLAALMFTQHEPSASFFLMPFRVYEFGLGAGLALLPLFRLSNIVLEVFCFLGLMMIAYSALTFDKFTPFPDIYALLPCIGAVLLIAGGSARRLDLLLRNPLSVWIGRISYSLYLVHWPIVVLYKHITFEDAVVGKTRLALMVLTFMAAALLFYGVEKRFRLSASDSGKGGFVGRFAWLLLPLSLLLPVAHAYTHDGWTWRFDAAVVNAIGNIAEKQLIRREFIEGPKALATTPFDEEAEERVLVMGDSHSTDMFNALYLNVQDDLRVSVRRLEIDDVCLYLFAGVEQEPAHLSAVDVARCGRQFDLVQSSLLLAQADRIVVSTRWETTSFPFIESFAHYLVTRSENETAPDIIIMGRTAEYKSVPSLILKNGLSEAITQQLSEERFRDLDELNLELEQTVKALQLHYIDKLPFLCQLQSNRCDAVDVQGRVLYTDYGHWTVEGARLFGQRMLADEASSLWLTGLPKGSITMFTREGLLQ